MNTHCILHQSSVQKGNTHKTRKQLILKKYETNCKTVRTQWTMETSFVLGTTCFEVLNKVPSLRGVDVSDYVRGIIIIKSGTGVVYVDVNQYLRRGTKNWINHRTKVNLDMYLGWCCYFWSINWLRGFI